MKATQPTRQKWEELVRQKLPVELHGLVLNLLFDPRMTSPCKVIRIEGFFIQEEPFIECYFYPVHGPELYQLVDLPKAAFDGVITPEIEFKIRIDLKGQTLGFGLVNSMLPQSTNSKQTELSDS